MTPEPKKNPIDFSMGADVEFIVSNNRKLICENKDYGVQPWGADGSGYQKITEVRPKPSHNPLKIVLNIRQIFLDKVKSNPVYLKYKWQAGSYVHGRSIGAHTHFGVSEKIISFEQATNILDQYAGSISVLLERKDEALKRRKSGYGRYGDFRKQSHGFERRSSGSWLSCPYVAGGILSLDKVVMYELLNNKNFKFHSYVSANDFEEMDTNKIRRIFPKIWEDIANMTLYPHYKKHIDFLKFLVDNNLTWFTKKDMKQSWGIVDIKNGNPERKIVKNHKEAIQSKFKNTGINLTNLFTENTEEEENYDNF